MDTSIERIRAKITELEAKVADLRIAERELQALEGLPAPTTEKTEKTRKTRTAAPAAKPKRAPKAKVGARSQTIGAAIAEVLDQQGSVSAAEIAELIKATGRDITNRTVSFALQALKKRGLAKNTDGKWSPSKARAKQAAA
ncbi:MAG: winged-helix domain-containing protein [Methylocella sp.]